MGHGDGKFEAIAQLGLEFGLPGPAAMAVAAAAVGQDEQSAGTAVAHSAFAQPPAGDAVSGPSIVAQAVGQGREAAKDALAKNPELAAKIKAEILARVTVTGGTAVAATAVAE